MNRASWKRTPLTWVLLWGAAAVLRATEVGPLLPPAVIYHFGQQAHLIEDAHEDTIPQDIWDRFIVGGATTFGLNPFRRGLYGTVHPAFGDNFGEWFMAVHLKPECRTPQASIVPSALYDDRRVADWYAHSRPAVATLQAFQTMCFRATTALDGEVGPRVLRVENVPESGNDSVEGPCEKTLQQFYAAIGARVVLDEQWPEQQHIGLNLVNHVSWYLRDPACIDHIDGEERDVVHMLAAVPDLWGDQLYRAVDRFERSEVVDETRAITRAHSLRMLMVALRDVPESAAEDDLEKIRRDAADGFQQLHDAATTAQAAVPVVVDAFRRCRRLSPLGFAALVPADGLAVESMAALLERLAGACR